MTTYHEQRYPYTICVRITFDSDGYSFVDHSNGLNAGHALYRARDCWENATIDLLTISPMEYTI